jgi:hypothetical protein
MSLASRILALMPILLLPAAPGAAITEPPAGSLSGIILTPEEAALPGAVVEVCSRTAGTRVLVATDENGLYRVDGLPAARDYVVRVTGPGGAYAEAVQDRVVIAEGRPRTESFQLFHSVSGHFRIVVGARQPIVNLMEVGNRTRYDHVFLEGLPLWGLP